MSKIKFVFLIFLLIIGINVAVEYFDNDTKPTTSSFVPEQIIEKGNLVLIDKVGKDTFKKYIRFDPALSYHKETEPTYYVLGYVFHMPEKAFVTNEVNLRLSDGGNFFYTDSDLKSLPNCTVSPKDCDFPIDETMVRKIAEEHGFEKGIEPWKIDFHWDRSLATPTYVWSMYNAFESFERDGRGRGKKIVINARTGKIITTTEWMAIQ